jgi:hypothetical protein
MGDKPMDLKRMMILAGVGGGEGCAFRDAFLATLSPSQQSQLALLIELGADVRHTAMSVAANETEDLLQDSKPQRLSVPEYIALLLEDSWNEEDGPIRIQIGDALRQALREINAETEGNLYMGELTESQRSVLSNVLEPDRILAENRVRQSIGKDGDPRLTILKLANKTILILRIDNEMVEAGVGDFDSLMDITTGSTPNPDLNEEEED